MSAFWTLIDQALTDPLGFARTRATGRKQVGIFGAEIPVELVDAAGHFAMQLPVRAEHPTPRADLMLESSFTPQSRSVAEQYLAGELADLDAIIFPRSDDSAQRLYYYLCEHQRMGQAGPRLLIYDLAKIARPTSDAYSQAATQRLAAALGTQRAAIDACVKTRNRGRALFTQAQLLRSAGRIQGGDLDRIARAAGSFGMDEFNAQLSAWIDSAPPTASPHGPRIILAGSAPPDERLHRAVENAGGYIVAEFGEYPVCARTHTGLIESAAHLSEAYQRSSYGARAVVDRSAALHALVNQSRADAVVLWLIEEEESLIWDLPAQAAALTAAGIPHLSMTRRRWNCKDGALDEIAAFVGTLASEKT